MEVILMLQVNVLEAKTDFSKLIRILETRKEDYITVARNGKPIIKMTLINETPVANRIGIARMFAYCGRHGKWQPPAMRLWNSFCGNGTWSRKKPDSGVQIFYI